LTGVPHEKQLIKMANQKKLALQAKVDLKRFIIDRSLSMEIEGTRIWFMIINSI